MSFKMKGFTPFTQSIDAKEFSKILREHHIEEHDESKKEEAKTKRLKVHRPEESPLTQNDEEKYPFGSKEYFQFGEQGAWGEKYQQKKQDKKDSFRLPESIAISKQRKIDKKYFEKHPPINISSKDFIHREKNEEDGWKYSPAGKWDRDKEGRPNYITIGRTEDGNISRVLKEDYDRNKDYQKQRKEYLDSKKTSSDIDEINKKWIKDTKKENY